MSKRVQNRLTLIAALTLLAIPHAFAQDAVPTKDDVARAHDTQEFSPYAGRSFPTRVLFCDTHQHTAISVDAGTMNRLGQEEAYRFARGEEVNLIAMYTHDRKGLAKLMKGSIAEKVQKKAATEVQIFMPSELVAVA